MQEVLRYSMPVQALLASVCTWLLTSAGALAVFCFRKPKPVVLNGMLALGAGIMTASSFWSLLEPSIAYAQMIGQIPWLVVLTGFLGGALALLGGDAAVERLIRRGGMRGDDPARRRRLLMSSITLHNIPEGLVIGIAFGAALSTGAYRAAWMLALGIGLQNVPEGAAISLPLHRDGMPRAQACLYGALSGVVEPIACLMGALLAAAARQCLPVMLAFAAGAMMLVVVLELIPESQREGHRVGMTLALLCGFALMMVLDVGLS
ncbi:MAG: ZIP family metal transporter [bacterium]|nr:ZIP family metal transporter [bacterium]